MTYLKRAALAALLIGLFPAQGFANCYELIGCDDSAYFPKSGLKQLSCQSLWEVRNTIYKENGYCFTTQRAIDAFGNDGCYVHSQGAVKLNHYERYNVRAVKKVEHAKGC
jgi:YARHG domain